MTWRSRTAWGAGSFAALLSSVLLAAAALVGCGSSPLDAARSSTAPPVTASATPSATASPATSSPQATSSPPATSTAAPGFSNVFQHALLSPQVSVTHGAVFVAWQLSPPGGAAVHSELARIDAATGRIEARQHLSGMVDQALEAGGSLWVATQSGSMPSTKTLLTLNPATLRVSRQQRMGVGEGFAQSLVVADGSLWAAGGNRLLRLSLPAGTVTASIDLPEAASSDVSANAAGTILILGEANDEGVGTVERRDPATGALLASYPALLGVAAPTVAGPVGSAVWMSEATGMMGYVQRLDAASMRPDGSACAEGRSTSTCVFGTNDIAARIADGLLWVTQVAGGQQTNYCAEPLSGRMLAPLVLPRPGQDEVLAIASDRIFYAAPGPKADEYLRQEPVPAACGVS